MSLIDSSRVEGYLERVAALDPGSAPDWGSMAPEAMLDHLCNSLEIAMGRIVAPGGLPDWASALLRPLGLLPLPMPRGVIRSTREFLTPRPGSFEEKRERFAGLLREFHRQVLGDPARGHRHPVFGRMSMLKWAALQDRHIEHHFRQFRI